MSRLEQMTGGRVEIERFDWNLSRLEFDVHGLTIHGLEGPNEVPYAHADRLLIDARIVSLFKRQIALDRVELDRPVIHLIIYPDGHTNQPTPKAESGGLFVQSIFDLEIKHAELRNGELLLNEHSIPFSLSANDLQASMKYEAANHRYDGNVRLTIEQARYSKYLSSAAEFDVTFDLLNNELGITNATLKMATSKIEASGKLTNFANPTASVSYRATINGQEFARMFRVQEIRRGQVDLNGTATYANSAASSAGKLVVRNLDVAMPGLRLPNIDGAADYSVDESKLTLNHLVGRVFGGIGKGDAVLRWAAPPSHGSKGPAEQTGLVRLNVDNMPGNLVAQAFSTPDVDLTQLHPVGTGRGAINIRWRGSPARALVDLDVSVSPPASFAPDETPVTGDMKGSYDVLTQELHADTINITLPYLHVSGSGTLNSRREGMHLTTEVSDLTRVRPVLAILGEQHTAAGELAGRMQFDGTLTGKLLEPSVAGHLQVTDFTFPLAAIWTPPPPLEIASSTAPRQPQPKYIHIDSGVGDIALGFQGISVHNATVRRAGAQAQLDVSIGLTNGVFTDSSPVAMHVVVHDAAVADLQQIAGYNYPFSGKLATNLNIHGTRLNLQGGGHVQLTDGSVYGESVKSANADVLFVNQEAQVNNFTLVHDHSQITGSGAYNLKEETFRFQVVGSNFELATIPNLNRNHIAVSGRLNFNASGSGTVDAPIINASAHVQNVVVNGQRVGDARLLAVTRGDTMHLTGQSNFQSAEVDLDGNIRMRDVFPAKLILRFSNFDFMPFMQSVFQTKLAGQSYVGGSLTLDGPLKEPGKIVAEAVIPKLTAQMEGVELHNEEPIRVTVANQVVRLESLHLAGTDTRFTAGGTVSLVGNQTMDLHADGRLNLKLAQSFNSDINSNGFVDLNVVVSGTVLKPNIVGEVKVSNGAVSLIDFPNGLSSINGTLVFNEQRVQVQSLTARTGGGDIRIGGFASYNPGLAFNITVQGEDIRMRYPKGVSTSGNLDLKLVGTPNSSTLSGDVTITRFSFNNQFDVAEYLSKSIRPPEAPRISPLNNVRFNIHVVSTPQLQIESSLAKVAGNADLRIRGTPVNPILLGHINITEGQLEFNGATYRIDRGDVSFLNPAHTEATIDVAATTRVRDYDITLRFSGEPSHGLKTNYSSDPPLPAADIINLLAFGQTREEAQIESTQGTALMTETVSNAILGQAISNAVSDRMTKLFGVSRVKISPEVGGAQTNPTAQVTIEQQVSNKVTVTYISNLTQSSQQSIFVEYYIDRNVSVIAGRDQYGVVSFDLRIRQRKR